ncbi:MAG: hypothetical protein ACLP2Y_01565 [Limisphaerales bacterium]
MVAIKIICGCGQKYAFNVYPLNGRMPAPVQCPVCGMDGTAIANEAIARTLGAQLAPQPVPALNNPAAREGKKGGWKWWQSLLAGWRGSRPVTTTSTAGSDLPVPDDVWRQRALMAELRAEQAQAVVGASLAPHLAQALKEALVQELAVQRKELLQAQQIAAAELAQLTHHLDDLRAPLQERLRSYEMRIQELEKELAARNEENRELLKLKIDMLRHQLEIESTRNRMEFN